MSSFEIISFQPINNGGLWKAELASGVSETVSGIDVAQGAKLAVRFAYDEGGSVTGLIEAAFEAAKRSLTLNAEQLDGISIQQLRDDEERSGDEARNFQLPEDWSPTP